MVEGGWRRVEWDDQWRDASCEATLTLSLPSVERGTTATWTAHGMVINHIALVWYVALACACILQEAYQCRRCDCREG